MIDAAANVNTGEFKIVIRYSPGEQIRVLFCRVAFEANASGKKGLISIESKAQVPVLETMEHVKHSQRSDMVR